MGRMAAVFGAVLFAASLWAAPAAAREAEHAAPAVAQHAPAAVEHETPVAGATVEHPPAHAAHEEHAPATPHLPNLINLALKIPVDEGVALGDTHLGHIIHRWEMQIFMVLVTLFGIWLLWIASKLRAVMPTRGQVFFEMIHDGFHNFLGGILGTDNLKYVPFLGTLFMFIYLQNVVGIIPLITGGTASYATTAALALMVFFYVQINGIRAAGFGHWVLGVFMLPLEIIGTLAKPLSLSLRLFGNMMGEHILVGVFMIMGVNLVLHFVPMSPVGLPLHLPFLFLALLTTFIQALVFTLLSTIYLVLLLPHDDHHADEMHDLHHDEKHGLRDDHGQHVTAGQISPV